MTLSLVSTCSLIVLSSIWKEVRKMLGLQSHIKSITHVSALWKDEKKNLLSNMLYATILRCIWITRNDMVFNCSQWFGMQVMWRKVLYNLAQWKILLKEEERGRMPTMLNQLELLARMLPLLSWPTPENKTRMTLEVCNLNGVRGLGSMLITAEDLARTLDANALRRWRGFQGPREALAF
jgi:hypothetical protein